MIFTVVLTLLSVLANCGSAQPHTGLLDRHPDTHSSRSDLPNGWKIISLDQVKNMTDGLSDGGLSDGHEGIRPAKGWTCEKRNPLEATSINSCQDVINKMFAHFDSDTWTINPWTCNEFNNGDCMATICNADNTALQTYSVREITDIFVYPLLQKCVAVDGSWGHYWDSSKSYVLTKYGNYYGLGP